MAVTRIVGKKYLKLESVEGAKLTNAANEGQIAEGTINTFNITDNAITNDKIKNDEDFTFKNITSTEKLIVGTDLEVTGLGKIAGNLSVATDKFTVDAITGNVIIAGDLTVNGDNIIANTTTLEVEDKNITVAKGGTVATANGSGITVDITDGTSGSLVYKSTSASKFAAGELGAEQDLVSVDAIQTLTNKTIDFVNGDGVAATELTINGTKYQDLESAIVALNAVAGAAASVEYTDTTALVGSVLTVVGATSISAVYVSGIRLSEGAGNDYTTAGNIITFLETFDSTLNIVVDYK